MPTLHHRAPRPLWLTLVAGAAAALGAGLLIACSNTTGGGGISAETLDRRPADGEDPDDYAAQIVRAKNPALNPAILSMPPLDLPSYLRDYAALSPPQGGHDLPVASHYAEGNWSNPVR